MSFDLRQIELVIAAADHGSFYRAAQILNMEQSTLSRSISKLERSIGSPIFKRSRAGVTMTPAGEVFICGVRPLVASAERLVGMMRSAAQGRSGKLVLGCNSSVSAGNIRAVIAGWLEICGGAEIEWVEADRSVLLGGLDTGEVDIAILLGATSHNGFRCSPFWSERILLALAASHPLNERDRIQWTDLRFERICLTASDPGPAIRDMLISHLAAPGQIPSIRLVRASRETILSILGLTSDLSVVCDGSSGVRYPDVVYRPIYGEAGPAFVSYSGYWRDDNSNPVLRRFLKFIEKRYALTFDLGPIMTRYVSNG